MTVLLTSAGIGSRLSPLTKYFNKPLLKFKVKLETKNNGVKTKVIKKVYFAPSDYELQDSFWLE